MDLDQSGTEERLSGTNINAIPFPATDNLRNAFRLMPSGIQDQSGRLHFQGGAEWQTNYLLEGFRIGDPIDGTLTARVHIGDWAPRAAFSGPIIRNRAWFSDNVDATFSQAYVPGQPAGANFSHQWSASNLFHTQWNLSPSNTLFTDFLVNLQTFTFKGLAPLTPISATQDQRYRQWLFGVKDQQTFARGFVIEAGFAQQNVFRRTIPQGDQPYIITPLGQQGNYFVNSTQTGRRDQLLANAYLPIEHWLGTHQIKFGGQGFQTRYDGLFRRTSFEHVGLNGQLLSRTTFAGSGQFTVPNVEEGAYFVDQWKPWDRMLITLGVRQDWDELIGRSTWSPRISVSTAPFRSRRTRLFAGFA